MGVLSPSMMLVLGDGTYDAIHSVIGEIQRSYNVEAAARDYLEERAIVQIWYTNRHRCVKIHFTKYAFTSIWVYFSIDLATMLGFEPVQYHWYTCAYKDKEIYANRPVLLTASTSNVFV